MPKSMSIPSHIPPENITLQATLPHMEVIDTRNGDVWLHQSPTTLEFFKAFQPEPPFMKSGLGCSAMDVAWFLRSPGATDDGPLETRQIGGLQWSRVARPVEFRGIAPGAAPTRVIVDKHHVIGWHAGSTLHVARLPDGYYYLQQTVPTAGRVTTIPDNWAMFTLTLEQAWNIPFGSPPAEIYFFRSLSSFAGPFTAEQFPGPLLPSHSP